MPKLPSYRTRKGRAQALVTLTDSVTKRRRDYWLGEHGTPTSREAYHRVIAAWEANGRRLPRVRVDDTAAAGNATQIREILLEYYRWARGYYRVKHMHSLVCALQLLRKYFGSLPAEEFGPSKLRVLRDEMIRGDANESPPRKPWSRKYINSQVQRIRHIFKWAAAREMAPVTVHQALCTLEPLKRGRTTARENTPVKPVPDHLLEGVRPILSTPVRAVVELQLLTGARPGELLQLRPMDIARDEQPSVWVYRPEKHKNAYREKERVIFFGPKAQEILEPFLANRPKTTHLFSPAEADQERREALRAARKTPLSCGNKPGSNRRLFPKCKPSECYTTPAYHRAIQYACDRAFPPPEHLGPEENETKVDWTKRLTAEQQAELKAWRKSHRWHPHQLRHNAATLLRREFGLEAAQLALGHASAQITDAVYAERDRAKVVEIMRRIG